MAKYVLAMEDDEKIVVGRPEAFIDHVGKGVDGGDFVPERVADLAKTFELFDETGRRLEVRIDGGAVKLEPVEPKEQVPGPQLVARVNFILGKAQADLDRALADALERVEDATAAVSRTARTVATNREAIPDFTGVADDLSTAFEDARPLVRLAGFPVVLGTLPVVLAALTEDFGLDGHTGAPPPNQGNDDHMELHRQGRAHK